MRKLFTITLFSLASLFIYTAQVEAAIIEKEVSRVYTIQSDRVHVAETVTTKITDFRYFIPSGSKEIFTIFNPINSDNQAEQKIQQSLPTIKAVDGSGRQLTFTTKASGQDVEISVVGQSAVQLNQPYTVTVEYDSFALLTKTGAIYDFYVPAFSKDSKFTTDTSSINYTTKVVLPKSLGEVNFSSPQKDFTENGENREFTYSQAELIGLTPWIQIGVEQYYQFEIRQPYSATSEIPLAFNTYSVLLPRDIDNATVSQKVQFTQLDPSPEAIVTDELGNLVGKFSTPANSSGEIVIKGYATVTKKLNVDLTKAGTLSDISTEIKGATTANGKFWEVDSADIQKAAKEIQGSETDAYQLLAKTYKYVIDRIDYSEVKRFGLNQRQGALKTLLGGAAVCMEYSDLFIALMRAQGLPARGAFGYGYDSRATDGVDTAHQWAEVYLPALQNWVSVDTTWGDSGTTVIGGSLNHFYRYVAVQDPQTPSPVEVAFVGSLSGIANEKFSIQALEKIEEDGAIQSPDQLLRAYPERPVALTILTNLGRSAGLLFSILDVQLTALLTERLQLNASLLPVVKGIVYVVPPLFIVTMVLWRSLHGRRFRIAGRQISI